MLTVEHLSAAYGPRPVLHDVSFTLPPGVVMGLIGPNGAGKSSLIRALSGVMPLTSGRMQVEGRDLASLNPMERARRMAVVPQARQLPPGFTAWEVVALGRTPHLNWLGQASAQDEDIVRRAMEQTDTLDLAGRRLGELSGGEQQRLLLARALAQQAPVLLLDEPTTHLDLHHQLALLDRVRELARSGGYSALVVLHDLNLVVRYADQALLLVDGHVQASGAAGEVLRPDILSAAYRVPLQVIQPARGGYPVIVPAIR